MKNFPQLVGHRAKVSVRWHDFTHVHPPLSTDVNFGNALQQGNPLYFRIGKQLASPGIKKYGVTVDPMRFEDTFEFRPNRIMSFYVFVLLSGIDLLDKSCANHILM
jgi:hypothetical protein